MHKTNQFNCENLSKVIRNAQNSIDNIERLWHDPSNEKNFFHTRRKRV